MNYLLGIDIGTTNMKGVLYNELGEKIKSASRTYETYHYDNNTAEQNPDDWWKAAVGILNEITDSIDDLIKKNIKAISISSQTPTLLPVTENGRPLRDAIIWMDRRADKELQEILDEMGKSTYISITGMIPDVSFLPPKILWYKKNETINYKRTKYFLQANSYVNYKLTGVMSMDMDQASLTQCLDENSGHWSREIGEVIGVDLEKFFPDPAENYKIIGTVSKKAAELTGLNEGVAVTAGSSDAIAAMYASGLHKMGEAAEVAGTSSLVFAGTKSLPEYNTVVAHKCAIDDIPYVYNTPISSTGASIEWYLKTLGYYECNLEKKKGMNVYQVLDEEAAKADAGSNGLLFFPYMMGERAPLWNNHARGMFIGLTMDTKRKDIVRAILEGSSFALKTVLEEFQRNGTKFDCIRIVGGGANSEIWLSIKASILNLPVKVLDRKTGDVPFGDALIAGKAVGLYTNLGSAIKDIVKVKKIIKPRENWVKIYDEMYPYFKKFYKDLDKDLKSFNKIMKS